ncbi:MAG: ethanolamine ammonia-lyase subunit EutB [Gemmataceae bacterium]|nr:ethanolamine ammonia-lyase subunit EutB [Gemmataceae bacterium]
MVYSHTIRSERFSFGTLAELFAKANEPKSGDVLAGIAAQSERERIAAKLALADLSLASIVAEPLIDPDQDDVSRLLQNRHDKAALAPIATLCVGEFREWLLRGGPEADTRIPDWKALAWAITPEIAAAVTKLLSNKELVGIASRIQNVARCRNTTGLSGTLGIRIQPNHPTDDLRGIVASTLDGLLMGAGDAVIGVNPAVDSVESVAAILHTLDQVITSLSIPTQNCCLAHITTQLEAMRRGAPVDLLFQSIGGTQATNASFGVSLSLLREGLEQTLEHHSKRDVSWVGKQAMYFETGQGSSLSAGAHHGVDQLTLEARAYGVAREFDPFLVNSVVGFIGPEYLFDERQIIRAGLEDHFMGKLLGLPMGVDVCFTNHAEADHNSLDNLLLLLAQAGCNHIMGVPSGDDVMLGYQTTSFHDGAYVRSLLALTAAPEFQAWLESRQILKGSTLLGQSRNATFLGDLMPLLTDRMKA